MLRYNEADMLGELCGTLRVSGTEKGKVLHGSAMNLLRTQKTKPSGGQLSHILLQASFLKYNKMVLP